MNSEPLIAPAELHVGIGAGRCIAADCRFELTNPGRGREAYVAGHIPGARYAHLDDDLSSPVTGSSGRHPLPDAKRFAAFLSRIGWHPDVLLVAYDERSSAFAGRLWWLMRYFGLSAAVLDGGFDAWLRAGLPVETRGREPEPTAAPVLEASADMAISVGQVEQAAAAGLTLVDARGADRFAGKNETLDTRAGHIPGALNRPYTMNLDADGCFKSADRLRAEFRALLGEVAPDRVVNYCGSGVSACHNLIALERAGISGTRLYPGSWSEWLRDADRPVATGQG